jgi:CheY-like chemotaxis protein
MPDGPKVLIVEDHPTMRGAMRMVLEEGGYRITDAAEGREALGLVREDPPDLVLLDLHVPGMSGAEILDAIRSDRSVAGTRVIVVTADGEEERERMLASGADAYLTKPFSPSALLGAAERVLGRTSEEA